MVLVLAHRTITRRLYSLLEKSISGVLRSVLQSASGRAKLCEAARGPAKPPGHPVYHPTTVITEESPVRLEVRKLQKLAALCIALSVAALAHGQTPAQDPDEVTPHAGS